MFSDGVDSWENAGWNNRCSSPHCQKLHVKSTKCFYRL